MGPHQISPISSIPSITAVKRPLSSLLIKPPIPFNMAALVASTSLSSHSHGSLLYSLPNWTRLTVDGDDALDVDDATPDNLLDEDVAVDTMNITNNDSSNSTIPLAPTYSTPRTASAAYQSGLLKSDFNISSNHPSVRLAFRYQSLNDEKKSGKSSSSGDGDEVEQNNVEQDDALFLCWVQEDGIPCHFRPMYPVIGCNNHVSSAVDANADDDYSAEEDSINATKEEHGNLRGTQTNKPTTQSPHNNDTATDTPPDANATNMLLVNENDLIETTFPGHAFVFCRRVKYDYNSTSSVSTDDGNSNKSSHNDGNGDLIVVNDNNGKTYFLRKKKCNATESNDEADKNGSQEAFLVVGGFRPMPKIRNNVETNNEEGKTEETGSDEESDNDSGDDSGDGSDDDSDDDSDDGREHGVQLVTIQCTKRSHVAKATIAKAVANGETESDDDDNLPSKVLGCSDCTQSVPFLRGAINPKPRHTPAFVATKTSNELELPQSYNNVGNETLASEEESDDDAYYEFVVTVCTTQLDPTPLDTSSKQYDEVILGGWPCRVEPGCFPPDVNISEGGNENENSSARSSLQSRFEADLLAASTSLPPHTIQRLKNSTPIWINKSQSFGPKAAPIKARDGCFHPGSEWLERNGMNPDKCGGVEWYDAQHYLSDCDLWGPGGLMLHELSHAWHCLHIENGYDNEDIINVYKQAMEDGLYDCVRVHGRQGTRRCKAYACQDEMEYFAELSVAFLGGLEEEREHNKWYPFNRKQVREHDPRAFDMLCRMWGVVVVEGEDDGNSLSLNENDAGSLSGQGDNGEASKES